jgi:hypothetical protein
MACALEPGKHYELRQSTWTPAISLFDDNSLRITFNKKLVLLSHGPDWQICILNPTSKRKYKTTEAGFKGRYLYYISPPMPVLASSAQKRHEMTFGRNVTTISCSTHDEAMADPNELFFRTGQREKQIFYDEYIYTVCDDTFPIPVCHILQDLFRVPTDSHLPLRFYARQQGQQNHYESRLFTNALTIRDGPIDTTEPADYKLCQDPDSVCHDQSTRDDVESGLSILLGDDKKPSKHAK